MPSTSPATAATASSRTPANCAPPRTPCRCWYAPTSATRASCSVTWPCPSTSEAATGATYGQVVGWMRCWRIDYPYGQRFLSSYRARRSGPLSRDKNCRLVLPLSSQHHGSIYLIPYRRRRRDGQMPFPVVHSPTNVWRLSPDASERLQGNCMAEAKDTLLRQLTLLRLIPKLPHYTSSQTLHEKLHERGFKVDLRTVQRDLNRLSTTFSLTSQEHGGRNKWSHSEDTPLDLGAMEPDTALALYLAESHLKNLLPQSVLDLLGPQFNKARNYLDELDQN